MNKNAIELLKEDHKKVKSLLAELTETTTRAEKTRTQLLAKIEQELMIHTDIEEKIFYPAFKEAGNSEHSKMYFEALEEHRTVDELVLPDLKKTPPTSEKFSGRAKVLKELIEHHADEEEKEMFKEAAKSMDKDQLAELGRQMSERKLELQRQMRAA
ncbi:MAG TPA: hemerythrin domain-containing protein [Woeseiaceae bacterium]|nr:hemerythrin domain-containing protein [Woeseiaceae bacterium]